jgi:hypothetical protein
MGVHGPAQYITPQSANLRIVAGGANQKRAVEGLLVIPKRGI